MMSGIAGFLDSGVGSQAAWCDGAAGIGLDGAVAASRDGRWVAALDGTLYNRADLRRRLDPVEWAGRDDAETLVEAVARWGIERALQALDGQFAIALWDRLERVLHLARDPMGERTLYWARCGGGLRFASRLGALTADSAFDAAIDRDAVATYLRLGHVPAPFTIHRHARKVVAGTILTLKGGDDSVRPFWDAAERARAVAGGFTGGPAAAAERLNLLLRASVSLRLEAEPVVGVILTGDAQSALAAAVARALGTPRLSSVSLAADGDDPAAAVARVLETDHHAIAPTDDDLRAILPDLAAAWDEPFADPAMPAAVLTARLAARHMKVALAGTGAEILMGCDPLYRLLPEEWARRNASPSWLRRLEHLVGRAPAAAPSQAALLGLHRSLWRGLPDPVPGAKGVPTPFDRDPGVADPVLAAMVTDCLASLPDRRLALAGGAAMAQGIELRSPFLDPAMVELAWSLPTADPLDEAGCPACLRDVLCRYLPPEALPAGPAPEAPLARWLDGPLAEWAGDLLSEARLKRRGLIDPAAMARCRREAAKGQDRTGEIWAVLMLEAWAEAATHPIL
ncbi:MAG TPA: asparagine synthase-related protein [Candidatus Omnitrophota bacterium]|nr:asparagine synthase-related protein [Candidatus Omnitrophota bacterium]